MVIIQAGGDVWKEVNVRDIKDLSNMGDREACMELAKRNRGTRYRVRSIWDSKIEMEVML